jgi:hypothetical protein
MKNKIPKITHEGILPIGNTQIPCYVLDNGQRVLSGRGVQNLLKLTDEHKQGQEIAGSRLKRLFNYKAFKPILLNNLGSDRFQIIKCRKGKKIIHGYNATSLVDLCDAIIEVKNSGVKLTTRQKIIATQAEILIRSVAKVGIIALVDEATGFQRDRDHEELQKILEAYINKEFLPWSKVFPDEFYEHMFRLRGWRYSPLSVKRPQLVGKLTNKIVYDKLPPGVLKELKEITPKSKSGHYTKRFHQGLTIDIGHRHLENHLAVIITLMRVSPNWRIFEGLFNKAFPKNKQMKLLDETEYSIEDIEEK